MKFNAPYDLPRQRWDRYNHFHIPSKYGHYPFVRFATGELAVDCINLKPRMRRFYPEFNVTITSTRDKLPALFTVEGQRIPKEWMHHCGCNWLMIDHDTKRVVGLSYNGLKDSGVPVHMQGMAGGFLGENMAPIMGAKIWARPPQSATDTPERKAWREALTALCQADAVLNEIDLSSWQYARPVRLRAAVYNRDPHSVFQALEPSSKHCVAYHGVEIDRDRIEYPYLLIK